MTILMLLFVVILNTSIDLHQAAISFYVYFIFYVHSPKHPAVHPRLVAPLPLILDLGAIPRGGGDGVRRASTASTDSCLSNLTVGCVLPKKYPYFKPN